MQKRIDILDSWSTFYSYRKTIRRLYPSIWDIPLIKKLPDIFLEICPKECSLLDVGAHDRKLGERLAKSIPGLIYKTMDIDPVGDHDYHSMNDINERFDTVNLSEVIEHLCLEHGVKLLTEIGEVLKPGGYLVVSTPNLNHPHRYWDPDHKTPYRYDALAGLLLALRFKVEVIFRVHNEPFPQLWLRRFIGVWLHRYLDIDFAKSIIVVARSKDGE